MHKIMNPRCSIRMRTAPFFTLAQGWAGTYQAVTVSERAEDGDGSGGLEDLGPGRDQIGSAIPVALSLLELLRHFPSLIVFVGLSFWKKMLTFVPFLAQCGFRHNMEEALHVIDHQIEGYPMVPAREGQLSFLVDDFPVFEMLDRGRKGKMRGQGCPPPLTLAHLRHRCHLLGGENASSFTSFLEYLIKHHQVDAVAAVFGAFQINPEDSWDGELESGCVFGAIQAGCLPLVKFFLQRGADPNATDSLGYTLVERGESFAQDDIIKFLLSNGATRSRLMGKQLNPGFNFYGSVDFDVPSSVEATLKQPSANPNEKDDDGFTPLYYVVARRKISAITTPQLVTILINAGANLDAQHMVDQVVWGSSGDTNESSWGWDSDEDGDLGAHLYTFT